MDIDHNGPVKRPGNFTDNPDHVVCPECGSEFQPNVTHCIDCGALTVSPGSVAPGAATPSAPIAAASPPVRDPDDVSVRTDTLDWIEGLQALFKREGIASRIYPVVDLSPRDTRYEIAVAPRDARRAFALDREFLQGRLGDDEIELAEIPPPGVCPYCGSEAPADSTECPRCGLVIAYDNLVIVQSLYEAFAEQDREQILALFDPGIEWIQNEGLPGGGRFVGAETVMSDVFGRLSQAWEGWGAKVDRWLDAGDSVVALGRYQGTNRATGLSMTAAFAHVLWLREGRVVRFEQYADTAKIVAVCPPA
jgi:ketosteroid isomerase-like protein/ribosomal protein L40E